MTKRNFDKMFKNNILPQLKKNELAGVDKPARRESYNMTTDQWTKDGILTLKQYNSFIIPNQFLN